MHLKRMCILLLLVECSISVTYGKLVDSVLQVFYMFADFLFICLITERSIEATMIVYLSVFPLLFS